jgi:hypothetical protein
MEIWKSSRSQRLLPNCADLAFGEASYDDIVFANGSESVRVGIIRRLQEIGVSTV